MVGLAALIMNLYMSKDDTLLYFFNNDQLHTRPFRVGSLLILKKYKMYDIWVCVDS